MKNKDINVINIESRNANYSWYGYHYQAICSLLYFLDEITKCLENGYDPSKIYLKIEYIEDFVIFNENEISKIFQVKKTLNENIMEEVYGDFMLEQAYLTNENIEYIILSDNQIEKLSLEKLKAIYTKEKKEYLGEIDEILNNIENKKFLVDNLNLRDSKSKLRRTRQIFRNILNSKIGSNRYDLNKIDLKEYLLNDIEDFKLKIINFNTNNSIGLFYNQLNNIQEKIIFLEEKIDNYIIRISKYIDKGCKNEVDIRYALVNLIYKKLEERVINKQQYIVKFEHIKNEILAVETNKHIWYEVIYSGRIFLKEKIDSICDKCDNGAVDKCSNTKCIINKIMKINFEKSLDNFNLELTTDNILGRNLIEAISNKASKSKIKFFKNLLLEFKDDNKIEVEISDSKDVIKICNIDKELAMISWLDSDDYYDDLIKYKAEHMNVYKEYDEILTKEYESEIDFGDIGIIKNRYEENYESPCNNEGSAIKGANVKFVTYKKYKEVIR